MGRAPTRNRNLPAGMRARHRGAKTYYFLDTGARPRREIPLGQDYVAAVQKWAELTVSGVSTGDLITFRHVAERYLREELPKKEPATRALYLRQLANLYKIFDDPPSPLDSIEPVHIRQYRDWRVKTTLASKKAKNVELVAAGRAPVVITNKEGEVPANREKALFSAIFNFAREKGLTTKPNPCAGIKSFKEDGRDIYIDDDVYAAVWEAAEPHLRDVLDVAYLTGQRPADVRKMTLADTKGGAIPVKQNKGKKKLRVAIEGELAVVLQRIKDRKHNSLLLFNNEAGQPVTEYELRGAFDRARNVAATSHPELEKKIREYQIRDLRAKAGTDTEESSGMEAAQNQLGHSTSKMTAHYVRNRLGKLVKPTK